MLYDIKIIQILMAPEGGDWDGKLLGLADDGIVYYYSILFKRWVKAVDNKAYESEEK